MTRRQTSTSAFGVSKRESHDATAFYSRFVPPEVSLSDDIDPHKAVDKLICGDARSMSEVPSSSVALVVTSPPYFAGKAYEQALGEGGVPASYIEYLQLLRDVFAECARTLEPGGRIAVNVANLGRRPYRSLSADVVRILQDDLRLLLRGEIIWLKQRGSSGSCAWGSFQRPANPVLRDLSERIVVASKGRFDRAITARERWRRGLPSEGSMTREDFMENTLDVWEVPPERATRVGHPAPFPVEIPARLIELYTYRGDLVLDPFCGSGTTAVAAVRTSRHYVGYDLDQGYVGRAEARVEQERRVLAEEPMIAPRRTALPAVVVEDGEDGDIHSRVVSEGRDLREIARLMIEAAGFEEIETGLRYAGGVAVEMTARDALGESWLFQVAGGFTSYRPGLGRTDTLWKVIGTGAVLREVARSPLVVLTAGYPPPKSVAARVLAQVCGPGKLLHAVVDVLDPSAAAVLRAIYLGKRR